MIPPFTSTATLLLATPLRRFTEGASSVSVRGTTLAEIIQDAGVRFPRLYEAIIEDGELVPFVSALIDGASTGDAASLTTPVPDGSTIRLLCAVAGG